MFHFQFYKLQLVEVEKGRLLVSYFSRGETKRKVEINKNAHDGPRWKLLIVVERHKLIDDKDDQFSHVNRVFSSGAYSVFDTHMKIYEILPEEQYVKRRPIIARISHVGFTYMVSFHNPLF